MSDEECQYYDRQKVADSLQTIYEEMGYVVDNLQGSLEGVERSLF